MLDIDANLKTWLVAAGSLAVVAIYALLVRAANAKSHTKPKSAVSDCPDCGGKVSHKAAACPHCGRPTK